jgi:hypothetical protein
MIQDLVNYPTLTEGLSTLTYTPGQMSFLISLLGSILPIGYPDESPTKIGSDDKEAKIFFNKFGVEKNPCRS